MTMTFEAFTSLLVLSRTALTASPNWTRQAPRSLVLPLKSSVSTEGLIARRIAAHLGCRSSRYPIAGSLIVSDVSSSPRNECQTYTLTASWAWGLPSMPLIPGAIFRLVMTAAGPSKLMTSVIAA